MTTGLGLQAAAALAAPLGPVAPLVDGVTRTAGAVVDGTVGITNDATGALPLPVPDVPLVPLPDLPLPGAPSPTLSPTPQVPPVPPVTDRPATDPPAAGTPPTTSSPGTPGTSAGPGAGIAPAAPTTRTASPSTAARTAGTAAGAGQAAGSTPGRPAGRAPGNGDPRAIASVGADRGLPAYVETAGAPGKLRSHTGPALLPYAVAFGVLDVLALGVAAALHARRRSTPA
jgi:hypothetical protein